MRPAADLASLSPDGLRRAISDRLSRILRALPREPSEPRHAAIAEHYRQLLAVDDGEAAAGAELDAAYRADCQAAARARSLDGAGVLMLGNLLDADLPLATAWQRRDAPAVIARLQALGQGIAGADLTARVRLLGLAQSARRVVEPMLVRRHRR